MQCPRSFNLVGYSDSSYGKEPICNDLPLRSKGCTIIGLDGGGVLMMMSRLIKAVATSATDAETRQLHITLQKMRGYLHLIREFKLPHDGPALIYQDNLNCVRSSRNVVSTSAMTQLLIESHDIKSACDEGIIRLEHKPRVDMHADIGTKNLPLPAFQHHTTAIRSGNFA
jgi:hypothetical protein